MLIRERRLGCGGCAAELCARDDEAVDSTLVDLTRVLLPSTSSTALDAAGADMSR